MRITIFQQAPDIGGSEIYMANLVNQWVKDGNQVLAFTNYKELQRLFKKSGADTRNLPIILDITGNYRGFIKSMALLPFAWLWYWKELKEIEDWADVIVMSGYAEKLLVTYLANKLKQPVLWLEFPPIEILLARNLGIPKIIYRKLASISRKIVVISKKTQKSLITRTGIAREKIVLIYPGSEIPSSIQVKNANTKAKKWKERLGIADKSILGNISRVVEEKGQEYLIRALPEIQKKFPALTLLIIGRGPDTKRLMRLADNLGIRESVNFLGFVKNRNAALAMMDVFIFPASWELEGFGLVIVEAMLMQKPIVAANYGPTKEILKHNKNGILVKPKNPKHLSRAIVSLLDNPNKADCLGKQAYKTAASRFDIKKSADKIFEELENAIAK